MGVAAPLARVAARHLLSVAVVLALDGGAAKQQQVCALRLDRQAHLPLDFEVRWGPILDEVCEGEMPEVEAELLVLACPPESPRTRTRRTHSSAPPAVTKTSLASNPALRPRRACSIAMRLRRVVSTAKLLP
jgi:hypothetical protein